MTLAVERHSRAKQIELGRLIAPRKKIYLDLRFWIILRDAALGIRKDEPSVRLLHRIRDGISAGFLLCPISAIMLFELLKQPHVAERRIATAALADELSLGVSLMRQDRIRATEVASFVWTVLGPVDLHDMQELVWTKAAYASGDVHPVPNDLPDDAVERIQIEFFDHLWTVPLSRMVGSSAHRPQEPVDYRAVSDETNQKCREFAHEITSYHAAYDIELRGTIEDLGPIASKIMADHMARALGRSLSNEERRQFDNPGSNVIYHGMRKPEFRQLMRSLHIGASIHASMRWDKDRKFKPNDWHDFQHAYAALGYCDAFFTERSLHHLLTRPQMALEGITSCMVAHEIDDALAIVESCINAPRTGIG